MFENITAFIVWLGSGPGIVAILSFVVERWGWFQKQTSKTRMAITWGLAFLLPQISLAVLDLVGYIPAEAWSKMETHFQAILVSVSVIASLLASEGAHAIDKRMQGKR